MKRNPIMIRELDFPDMHYLNAAIGWTRLGNPAEALQELNQIQTAFQNNPFVLKERWRVHARLGCWEQCISFALELRDFDPSDYLGWNWAAYSLHRIKRTEAAYDLLVPVAGWFLDSWIVPFNMACYSAMLGRLEEAEVWLGKALAANLFKVWNAAKKDADLKPMMAGSGQLMQRIVAV